MMVETLRPFFATYDAPDSGYLFPVWHKVQAGGHVARQAGSVAARCLRDDWPR